MTIFTTPGDISFEIADRLADRLRAADFGDWSINLDINGSGQSCSYYVDLSFDHDDDDRQTDSFCIRVSDHEARSYNRTGDFNVTLGGVDADTDVMVAVDEITEARAIEVEITDVDANDERVTRSVTEVEDEFVGYAADIEAAIDQAVAAVRRFFDRAIREA